MEWQSHLIELLDSTAFIAWVRQTELLSSQLKSSVELLRMMRVSPMTDEAAWKLGELLSSCDKIQELAGKVKKEIQELNTPF